MAELDTVGIFKYFSYELGEMSKLSADYRRLILELAESKMIPSPFAGFIKNRFFALDGSAISDFYCKFGYAYGQERILQNDALVFPFRRILFHRMQSIGNGSINPIYKLFRDFSDVKKFALEYKEDLSNPFSVA